MWALDNTDYRKCPMALNINKNPPEKEENFIESQTLKVSRSISKLQYKKLLNCSTDRVTIVCKNSYIVHSRAFLAGNMLHWSQAYKTFYILGNNFDISSRDIKTASEQV